MANKTRILRLAVFVGNCFCCTAGFSQTGARAHVLQEALTGQWRNVYVKMTLHTRTDNNSDTSMVMEADSTNWVARLGIQPIRTYFEKGGTDVLFRIPRFEGQHRAQALRKLVYKRGFPNNVPVKPFENCHHFARRHYRGQGYLQWIDRL